MISRIIAHLSLAVIWTLIFVACVAGQPDWTGIPTRDQVKAWLATPADAEGQPGVRGVLTDDQARVLSVLGGAQEVLGLSDEQMAPITEAARRNPDFARRMHDLYRRFADGQLEPDLSPMVWDGQETEQVPFCAAIGYNSGDGFKLKGSGFLIAPNAVVTAAHVAEVLRDAEEIEVRFGANFKRPEYTATAAPANLVVHDEYQQLEGCEPSRHDIAVVILDEAAAMPLACLPQPGDESSEGDMLVVGYGRINSFAQPDGKKRAAIATIVELPCVNGKRHCCVPGADIAAGGHDLGGDACKGDSGGPLVACDTRPDLVIGMTIHGQCPFTSCPTTVGVYLRLLSYDTWLRGIDAIEWAENDCP